MASFIDGLRQNQQQVQDAEAYRALVRSAEDNSLARNAALQTKAAYDNADIGYGLTRADVAQLTGRPTSEVSYDTLSDSQLQELGYNKIAGQKAAAEAAQMASRERIPLSSAMVANQANMQQAAQSDRIGLASQMTGRQVNPAVADRYVNSLPTPGGFEQNAGGQAGRYTNVGEITDRLPSGDEEIRMMKQKGAY